MTTDNYVPSNTPELIPETGDRPAQIKISKEYGRSLGLTDQQKAVLAGALVAQSICPAMYWFRDTPAVRQVLRVE